MYIPAKIDVHGLNDMYETVKLIVMHAIHTVTLVVTLKCRGNTVQFKERERGRQKKRRIGQHRNY